MSHKACTSLIEAVRSLLEALGVMFDRMYTLRNQLLHGGATWDSSVNRSQISQGAEIMGQVVPTVIHLMMDDYQRVWGDACYPVVDRTDKIELKFPTR